MEKSKVYFTSFKTSFTENLMQKLARLVKTAGIETIDFQDHYAAIKIHFGEYGNLAFLRPNYAKVIADFNANIKGKMFATFLYENQLANEDILSDLENDVKQIEENYVESTLIIIGSLGFTCISIVYPLLTNFWLGAIFIIFYAIPALCSGIGSKKTKSAI